MRKLKHLPVDQWPEADRTAFEEAYEPGDIFDETAGPGAHLAAGTRLMIKTSYRRWLGFLTECEPGSLIEFPAERITPHRLRPFVDQLTAECRMTTVAHVVGNLHVAARLIAPERDWSWLACLTAHIAARAEPLNRFGRLVPGWQTLDLGIELMDDAVTSHTKRQRERDRQYRDGFLLTILSLWLIRRRSLAALTVSRHLELQPDGANILLYPEDTKAKRAESFAVPEEILPYLLRYLHEVRPRLMGGRDHDGLWPSNKGCPLSGNQIYSIVRAQVFARFGKAMSLHDFRKAGATFIAMEAPDMIGLIPGVLHHASPDVGEQYYNLAQSVGASRRFAAYLERTRAKLRPIQLRNED